MAIQQVDKRDVRQQMEEDEQRINQQREAGKKIIAETINKVSKEFSRPDINSFSFERRRDHWYILDVNRRVVMRVSEEELTNSPSPRTPEVRRRFEARIRKAVIDHYKLSIPN
ncbi:MAG: hypothetical protein WBE72_06155 [Terracidiphilus sp.]